MDQILYKNCIRNSWSIDTVGEKIIVLLGLRQYTLQILKCLGRH